MCVIDDQKNQTSRNKMYDHFSSNDKIDCDQPCHDML